MPRRGSLAAISLLFLTACHTSPAGLGEPIAGAWSRPTPLHFGMYVTPDPAHNPIHPPERFTGFHVGTDFEILPGEEDTDIPVFAICPGKVAYSGFAEGYGGLLVQHCTIQVQDVTVIYGHLLIADLPKADATLKQGDQISILGPAKSHDTDGNRKHLHLGIHKGKEIDMRGYVQTEKEISEYIDPQAVL